RHSDSRSRGQAVDRAWPASPEHVRPVPVSPDAGPGRYPKGRPREGDPARALVTRFNYVNVVKSDQAVLTGLTKDGTFLIERGEVTRPVKNLRFTQSVLDAWNGLVGLSSQTRL